MFYIRPALISILYIYTMPAARTKKGKKSKEAAAPVPASDPIPIPEPKPEVEQLPVDDNNAMQTDLEPSSSTSPASNIVAITETAVVITAEPTLEMTEATPGDSEKESASKLTIEERKAKLDELRRKMVCLIHFSIYRFH